MKDVVFVTGNKNKAEVLSRLLQIDISHVSLHLEEIQSLNVQEIIEDKLKRAFDAVGKPVIVEDTALQFTALSPLPGPFIKFFIEQRDGLEKTCQMLNSFEDRSAVASCTYGFYDGIDMETFTKSITGTIASHPRGTSGFGWNALFCPDGYGGRTRAELDGAEEDEVTLSIKAIHELRDFLLSKYSEKRHA